MRNLASGEAVRLSVIVATRNRARSILRCLDSIGHAFSKAAPLKAEIVVVDNGSSDDTLQLIRSWGSTTSVSVQVLHEPCPGHARAQNRALRAARGELLAFTDDDCCLHPSYVIDLLRHDYNDQHLVLRCGRIELGVRTDLPLTISTSPQQVQWNRRMNSARHLRIGDYLHGCNMTMRRALVERIGLFDERFGPGAYIGSGEDTDFIYRAYLADATIEYVPNMTVFHYHGRKRPEAGRQLLRRYNVANGALFAHYLLKDFDLCYFLYRDLRNAARRVLTGDNIRSQDTMFSNSDLLSCAAIGFAKYLLMSVRRPEPLTHQEVHTSFRRVRAIYSLLRN
jgi:glycosyltransferase involved in cell wall biosynthesis